MNLRIVSGDFAAIFIDYAYLQYPAFETKDKDRPYFWIFDVDSGPAVALNDGTIVFQSGWLYKWPLHP